jgi:acyl-coenzyme A thioesterase PaaI-like protein
VPTKQWCSYFEDGFATNPVNVAHGLSPVSLNDDEAVLVWEPTVQQFNDAGGGDFVFGGAVGVALHVGVMAAAMVVLADDEFPMTVQEEHRFYRPAKFGEAYVLTSRPVRRTRLMLWTSTVITAQGSGSVVSESSAVNQIVPNPLF